MKKKLSKKDALDIARFAGGVAALLASFVVGDLWSPIAGLIILFVAATVCIICAKRYPAHSQGRLVSYMVAFIFVISVRGVISEQIGEPAFFLLLCFVASVAIGGLALSVLERSIWAIRARMPSIEARAPALRWARGSSNRSSWFAASLSKSHKADSFRYKSRSCRSSGTTVSLGLSGNYLFRLYFNKHTIVFMSVQKSYTIID